MRTPIATLALAGAVFCLAAQFAAAVELTADEIIGKNATARGGADAWGKIQTMVWVGHVESGTSGSGAASVPFVLELKRPNKNRFEIKGHGQTAVRVYDGSHGWKVHSTAGGMPEVEPYTAEELSFERDGQGIEMPFLNFDAASRTATLEGQDEIEGRKAYRLGVKMPSGAARHVWLDAKTFLVLKYEREVRNGVGQVGIVPVHYRDYRTVEGVQMPFTIEGGAAGKPGQKMVIDRIILNPPLDDSLFAKPPVPMRRGMVSVDIAPRTERPAGLPTMLPGMPPGMFHTTPGLSSLPPGERR